MKINKRLAEKMGRRRRDSLIAERRKIYQDLKDIGEDRKIGRTYFLEEIGYKPFGRELKAKTYEALSRMSGHPVGVCILGGVIYKMLVSPLANLAASYAPTIQGAADIQDNAFKSATFATGVLLLRNIIRNLYQQETGIRRKISVQTNVPTRNQIKKAAEANRLAKNGRGQVSLDTLVGEISVDVTPETNLIPQNNKYPY